MRILIISNPFVAINKEKRAVIERIASKITGHGGITDITYIMKPGLGKKYSSRASLEGYDAVYAAGGDGTVNEVASGLVGSPVPLGIIPLGTGNAFARGLNIPLNTDDVIDMLLRKKTVKIDTGKISSHVFLAVAGIGYDANIAHDFNKRRNVKSGLSKYFYIAVRNYFFKSPEKLKLVIDGNEEHHAVFGLTICNTRQYGSKAIIAPQADPRSGTLIAVLIPKLHPFKAIRATNMLFNGTINECKELKYITFKTLKIKREKTRINPIGRQYLHGRGYVERFGQSRLSECHYPLIDLFFQQLTNCHK